LYVTRGGSINLKGRRASQEGEKKIANLVGSYSIANEMSETHYHVVFLKFSGIFTVPYDAEV
jgi:hypothetical protein